MKKQILIFTALFLANFLFAQINIEKRQESKPLSYANGVKLFKNEGVKFNTYTICYENQMYNTLKDYKCFSFNDIDNAYSTLFKTIIEGFKSPKEELSFELEDEKIIINYRKSFGVLTVNFYNVDKITNSIVASSPELTEKLVKKLFVQEQ